jgi:hypothetical protein
MIYEFEDPTPPTLNLFIPELGGTGLEDSYFVMRIWYETEDGWFSIDYDYKKSVSGTITLNFSQYLELRSADEFKDFYIEFYISGNPSNFTLDYMTLSDYDDTPPLISNVSLDDTFITSGQLITLNYTAIERHPGFILIEQSFTGDTGDIPMHLVWNITMVNGTDNTFIFTNGTTGNYILNMTFFDNQSNWQKWTINYTVVPTISISAGYRNPVFIYTENTIDVVVISPQFYIEKIEYNATIPIENYGITGNYYDFSVFGPTNPGDISRYGTSNQWVLLDKGINGNSRVIFCAATGVYDWVWQSSGAIINTLKDWDGLDIRNITSMYHSSSADVNGWFTNGSAIIFQNNVGSGAYINHFNLTNEIPGLKAIDIHQADGYWWILDINKTIYRVNSTWDYNGWNTNISSQVDNDTVSLYSTATNYYMLGNQNDMLYECDKDWNYYGKSLPLAQDGNVSAVYIDSYRNNNFIIIGNNTKRAYEYTLTIQAGTNVIEYFNPGGYLQYYNFSFNINSTVAQKYNISIRVYADSGDIFSLNLIDLFFIERTSQIDIINLHTRYYQDDTFDVTVNLRDLYNQPLDWKIVNYTIEMPNGSIKVDDWGITDNNGNLRIIIPFNLSWIRGFYHLNCSFSDDSQEYLGVWEMNSFEIFPIVRPINDTLAIGLKVNEQDVEDGIFHFGGLDAESFSFNIDYNGTLNFDLLLTNISLYTNPDREYTFTDFLRYDFVFEQAGGPFEYIDIEGVDIMGVPDNWSHYYYNDLQIVDPSTYIYDRGNNLVQPLIPIGTEFYNLDGFSVELRYFGNVRTRQQLTETPRTDVDSIRFSETFYADKDYKFWYFTSSVDINQIDYIEHLRTGKIVEWDDIIIDDSTYKFELENKTEVGDVFFSEIDYDPDWNVIVDVLEFNGTHSKLSIKYKADLFINNVSIKYDLSSLGIYMQNWTGSSGITQSVDSHVLTIPQIDFTTLEQELIIEGNSSVPIASFGILYTPQLSIAHPDADVDFNAQIIYPIHSEAYWLPIAPDWVLDGVHYRDDSYDISQDGFLDLEGDLFGPGITSSYLSFSASPVSNVEEYVMKEEGKDYLYIKFDVVLPMYNAAYPISFTSEQSYELIYESGGGHVAYIEEIDDRLWLLNFELDAAEVIIKIRIDYVNPLGIFLMIGIPLIAVMAIALFIYARRNREQFKGTRQSIQRTIKNVKEIFSRENIASVGKSLRFWERRKAKKQQKKRKKKEKLKQRAERYLRAAQS